MWHIKLTKAAQTGNSRFLEECDNWSYDKTEDLEIEDILERNFSHLIVENIEMNVHGYTEKYKFIIIEQSRILVVGKVR